MTAKLATKYISLVDTIAARREAGASGIEYAGMIVVAALVVSLIVAGVNGANVTGNVTRLIGEIFS